MSIAGFRFGSLPTLGCSSESSLFISPSVLVVPYPRIPCFLLWVILSQASSPGSDPAPQPGPGLLVFLT